MVTQLLQKLSQNYTELLENQEYCDVTINVGEDPNTKIFRAHKNILCCRSPYLRRALSSNDLAHIEVPNISQEIFHIILR
ncbi:BTB/POZ protein [Glomus cerebriforme]|uniref:BTB/POZ protein n=1 Tax=Glomus cerebriforme TaxID=658196 RepID=A0A397TN80_9GLOM|nr:BTB/POZ protein [Glomus cerebriforme]